VRSVIWIRVVAGNAPNRNLRERPRDSSGGLPIAALGLDGPPQFHHDFRAAILPAAMESGNSRNISGAFLEYSRILSQQPLRFLAIGARARGGKGVRRIREFAGNFLKTRRTSVSQRAAPRDTASIVDLRLWIRTCLQQRSTCAKLRASGSPEQRGHPHSDPRPHQQQFCVQPGRRIQRMFNAFVPLARAPDESNSLSMYDRLSVA